MTIAGETNAAPRTAGDRGAPGRVVAAHRSARPTMLLAVAFTLAAPATAVMPHQTGRWLPLHLFLVGGLLLAISGATQMLAVTWSAAPAPSRRAAAVQRTLVAVGAVGVAVGRERGAAPLVLGAAGIAVVAGLVLLGWLLLRVRLTAVVHRFDPAIEGQLVAVMCGVAGSAMGGLLATGHAGAGAGDVRAAHVLVNVLGLVGLVIAATAPSFAATVARTKVSSRATPGTVRSILGWSTASLTTSVVGATLGRPALLAAGLGGYALGVVAVIAVLPAFGRRQLKWAGPRLVQLVAGLAWWATGAALWAVDAWHGDPTPARPLAVLVIGGYAQVLVGSLAYLGPVLRGGGHEHLSSGFAITRSWWSVVAGNAAAVAALVDSPRLAAALALAWGGDVAVRSLRLVAGRTRG